MLAVMAPPDVEALHRALLKKGFHLDDPQPHECSACKERAVAVYVLSGSKPGGRDIELCQACGHARSWRRRNMGEIREEDLTFDLTKFLG